MRGECISFKAYTPLKQKNLLPEAIYIAKSPNLEKRSNRDLLCVWAKENTFFFNVLRFFSNFVCVLITVELKHMQKGRFQNIEEHF